MIDALGAGGSTAAAARIGATGRPAIDALSRCQLIGAVCGCRRLI